MLCCYHGTRCYHHRHLRNLLTLISYFTLALCHSHFSAPAFVVTKLTATTKVVTSLLQLDYDDFSEVNLKNGASVASTTNNNHESSQPSNRFPKLYDIIRSPPISYSNDAWCGCCDIMFSIRPTLAHPLSLSSLLWYVIICIVL